MATVLAVGSAANRRYGSGESDLRAGRVLRNVFSVLISVYLQLLQLPVTVFEFMPESQGLSACKPLPYSISRPTAGTIRRKSCVYFCQFVGSCFQSCGPGGLGAVWKALRLLLQLSARIREPFIACRCT